MTARRQNLPADGPTASIGFVSLGCAKNLVDSQVMAGSLLENGFTLAPSPEDADVILVNTCAFIESAREEAIENILWACQQKGNGPCRAVIVAGCLTQRYKQELTEVLPEVDAFIGLDELDRVGPVVRRLLHGEKAILEVSATSRRLFNPQESGVVFTGGPYAYIKIAEGCNHRCTFCAIPGIRGRRRSRSIRAIVGEAEQLLEQGFKELVLIAQDTTSYGSDREDGADLPGLLRNLGKIGGRFWIRILYGFPSRVTRELLETMAAIPQVCSYLDIPVQHSHPDILKRMGRLATAPHVEALGDRVRTFLPGATLRTTCLVGFPGEKREHFDHLMAYVERTRFDHLGAFVFSPEEHTGAFDLADRPSRRTAQRRYERLLALQEEVVDANNRALLGQEALALLEHPLETDPPSDGTWQARTGRQAPEVDGITIVDAVPDNAGAGDFIAVRITSRDGVHLRAMAH